MLHILSRGFVALILSAALAGCATTHMTPVSIENQTKGPDQDKALVVFMRPSNFGGAIQSALYDGDAYIGTLSANARIAYQAAPGKHMFMVTGESADFMEADLFAGQTYYTVVVPRMGIWKARFSFRPHNGQIEESDLQSWLSGTQEVVPNPEGLAWAKENQAAAMSLKGDYLTKWTSKPERDQQRLHPTSGR